MGGARGTRSLFGSVPERGTRGGGEGRGAGGRDIGVRDTTVLRDAGLPERVAGAEGGEYLMVNVLLSRPSWPPRSLLERARPPGGALLALEEDDDEDGESTGAGFGGKASTEADPAAGAGIVAGTDLTNGGAWCNTGASNSSGDDCASGTDGDANICCNSM
jgi:hypothetical protein